MDDINGKELDVIIERAVEKIYSSQPRFTQGVSPTGFFTSTFNWLNDEELEAPDYSASSREYDEWLQAFWRKEPHLAGVVNDVTLIDANRGWTLVGGRNQVLRFRPVLHGAEKGLGWRYYAKRGSLSFWTTNIGFVTEIGREGKNGPMRGLYNVDPSRCLLTGDPDYPLKYYPTGRNKVQKWRQEDYLRVASLPSDREEFNGLGFCAVARAIEIAKIMVAVYRYDQEQLLARAPKGLLFLKNIDEAQWRQAMEARDARLTAKERRYYGGVEVFASLGIDEPGATLVALSSLPTAFDRETFTDQLMYTYALVFGYDPIEFWVVNAGVLGRGNETQTQSRKASGKGGLDMIASYQDQLQNRQDLIPPTLLFTFDERDPEGDLLNAQILQAYSEVAATVYESGLREGSPLVSQEEARTLLAEYGVIPREWVEMAEGELETSDEGETRERLRGTLQVRAAMERFPDEEIISYHWPSGQTRILWDSGSEGLRRRFYPGVQIRQDDEILFQEGDVIITEGDVLSAIRKGTQRLGAEFGSLLV